MSNAMVGGVTDDFINLGVKKPTAVADELNKLCDEARQYAKTLGMGTPFNDPAFRGAYHQWLDHVKRARVEGWEPKFEKPDWKDFVGKELFHAPVIKETQDRHKGKHYTEFDYRSLKGNYRVCVIVEEDLNSAKERKERERLAKAKPSNLSSQPKPKQ